MNYYYSYSHWEQRKEEGQTRYVHIKVCEQRRWLEISASNQRHLAGYGVAASIPK